LSLACRDTLTHTKNTSEYPSRNTITCHPCPALSAIVPTGTTTTKSKCPHWVIQLVAALAIALGGFGQVLVGIFEILKGSSFSFAVFEYYGTFWPTWAIIYVQKTKLNSTWGDAVQPIGSSLYLAEWGVLSFCFWVVTWRKNVALISIFFLLTSTFFLLSIATGIESTVGRKVGGYFGFATAVAAFYTGVAELINEEYGRPILPGLAPLITPQRVTITEEAVKNLINYDERTNTIWLQFRGLQIRTLENVYGIRDGVVSSIREAISTPQTKKKHLKSKLSSRTMWQPSTGEWPPRLENNTTFLPQDSTFRPLARNPPAQRWPRADWSLEEPTPASILPCILLRMRMPRMNSLPKWQSRYMQRELLARMQPIQMPEQIRLPI
jgi:succinate-acetate transporter protein